MTDLLDKAGSGSVEPEDFNAVVDAIESGPTGKVTAADIDSLAAQDGDVLTADGAGNATWEMGGGSQPGVLVKDFLFTEGATAGVYAASMPVLAGTVVLDAPVYVIDGPWAADTAVLDMSDTANGFQSYYDALDLVSTLVTPYATGSNVFFGSAWLTLQTINSLAYAGNGLFTNVDFGNVSGVGVKYLSDDTLELAITTTIAVPPVTPSGITLVRVLYIPPVTPTDATFS